MPSARPENHVIVLFGARGDLAKRMLLPALARLDRAGRMPRDYRVVGTGRHAPDGEWRDEVGEALRDEGDAGGLLERLRFVTADADDGADLAAAVSAARDELGDGARVLHYLSVPPSAMGGMVTMLGRESGLCERARIVMEKPFGHDLASAQALNAAVHEHFDEADVFRIDHFLGLEAAQDILALRFATRAFEPVWNREFVQAVFVDVPEKLGLEGRGAFYEETGALRDMVVTHLAQVMGLLAMERPASLEPAGLRDAKRALFAAVRPLAPADVVRGQFDGYRAEEGVAEDSEVETFVAARVWIDNERWEGVPFLLRTGKALAATRSVASLALRRPELDLFGDGDGDGRADELVVDLAEDPLLGVEVRVKRPGPGFELVRAPLRLDVERALGGGGLEPYERLLHDALAGDGRLFTRADEIERLWEVVAPVLDAPPALEPYAQGSWGPQAAQALAEPVGWRLPDGDG